MRAQSPYFLESTSTGVLTELTILSKNASEYYDPCQDFADRSLKCMKRNAFDKEMCGDYFQYAALLPFLFISAFSAGAVSGLTKLNCLIELIETVKSNGYAKTRIPICSHWERIHPVGRPDRKSVV